jgi:hypothetical protein
MLGDEMHRAIGELTVAGAKLENIITLALAWARGEDDEWLRKTLSTPGQWQRELDKLISDVEDGPFREQLRQLREAAATRLGHRHRIVHSVASLEQDEAGEIAWTFWHPKTDTDARFDAQQIRERAQDISSLSAKVVGVTWAAAQWHTASARPDGAPS